jgi:hypothetical protein
MSADRKLDHDWTQPIRYPDLAIERLDRRFAKIRIGSAAIERIWTGGRWIEGPVYFGGVKRKRLFVTASQSIYSVPRLNRSRSIHPSGDTP